MDGAWRPTSGCRSRRCQTAGRRTAAYRPFPVPKIFGDRLTAVNAAKLPADLRDYLTTMPSMTRSVAMSKHTESGASADDFRKFFAALAAKDEGARTNLRPDRVPASLSGGDRAQEPDQETRRTPPGGSSAGTTGGYPNLHCPSPRDPHAVRFDANKTSYQHGHHDEVHWTIRCFYVRQAHLRAVLGVPTTQRSRVRTRP